MFKDFSGLRSPKYHETVIRLLDKYLTREIKRESGKVIRRTKLGEAKNKLALHATRETRYPYSYTYAPSEMILTHFAFLPWHFIYYKESPLSGRGRIF